MRVSKLKKISKRKIKKIFGVIIAIVLLFAIYLNTYLIVKYNVLPLKFLLAYFTICGLIPFIMIFFTVFKNIKNIIRIILSTIEIIYIIVLFVVFIYLNNTFNFLDEYTSGFNYETKNYYVVVLKDSEIENIDDLKGKSIGLTKSLDTSIEKAIDELGKKTTLENNEYDDFTSLFDALYKSEVDSVLIIDSFYNMLDEESNLSEKVKIVYKFSIKELISDIGINVDVTKEPFNIYISGIDTYGSVTDKTRSDVNIIASVNPKTNKILLINIPRDYYVDLYSTNSKDKLTHAGIYGVDTSMKTIENLLGIKINYYIKLNYNALIGLVDALDGVEVYSHYNFSSFAYHYRFVEGYNKVNGMQALDFVRTRKAFKDGDRVRGEHQQEMIKAIINKAMSKTILIKYNDILKSLEGSFTTNISTENITSLINLQLDKMPKWNIESISLNGKDGSGFTYTYPNQELYIMIPDEETVDNAKVKINNLLGNE